MKETLRNHSYINVSLGIINQDAQTNATIISSDNMLYLSSSNIFGAKNDMSNTIYATLEENYTKVDGIAYFPPEDAAYADDYIGYISKGLCSEGKAYLEISFGGKEYSIKGLTITFDDYPIDFDVITDDGIIRIKDNTRATVELTNVFSNITFMRVVAIRMQSQHRRLRIKNILFGLGLNIVTDKIKDASLKSYVSPISDDVPQVDFNLKVVNKDNQYNIDNPDSDINFLETGQDLLVQYGFEIEDNLIEWFQVAKLKLQSWRSDEETAQFVAVDRLEMMSGTYYRGRYYDSTISLHDLAIDVLSDAGLESEEYEIDPYLKNINVKNPMPVVTHKEAIQIIANCARCAFLYTEQGKIALKSNFEPEMNVSGTEHELSNGQNVIGDKEKARNYAFLDKNFSILDGSMTFAPEPINNEYAIFVSDLVSNESGVFESEQYIKISLEAAYTTYGLTLVFEGIVPKRLRIVAKNDDNVVKDIIVDNSSNVLTVREAFQYFNNISIYFLEMSAPYSRARISKFTFKEITDYKVSKSDMLRNPTGIQLDKVKSISVQRTAYEPSTVLKQLAKGTYLLDSTNNLVEFIFSKKPSTGYLIECNEATEIVESSSFRVLVSVKGLESPKSVSVVLKGYEYEVTENSVTKTINTTGYEKSWNNPLISEESMAKDLCDWLANYFTVDKEYALSYRGDPSLQANDLSYVQSEYIDNLICRVYEHDIKYNGAISGSIKARRYLSG